MTHSPADLFAPAFQIHEPAALATPLVFNSPHSGRIYPDSFVAASRLDALTLRRSEDTFVDELFAEVVGRGAPLMTAHFPRAYLDVNREPYELDPRMFDGRLPAYANTRSMRVAGGLGTIARIVGDAQEIYARRLPVDEALQRIDQIYKPYHRALDKLLQRSLRRFGTVLLVDCHSMPTGVANRDDHSRADVVIGDRYGSSAAGLFADVIEHELYTRGYVVARNKPYAGGFITEHYGDPAGGCHAIQIEICRGLYMDERKFTRTANFARVSQDLMAVADALIREIDLYRSAGRLAAE
ncbi:N-formylglutamate amidohydrolase [Alsobacter metallidurans]|uniref:N-formylglutamate amidohydrolase n=1 Tax=Alsobacter metallidurans TaxID=340221 RepID=A0A917I9V0_9HYPH|nr:N-formylglutamate amidohydrolase [Alsobacter metallidurans]GGH30354.1 N-formylglutamate amidohydrolase [Alsobacter metallidurans]